MRKMLKKILTKDTFYIFILLLISLIPLLWYKPGTLGMGHDMGWSLVPQERLLERLYAWSNMGFGRDISLYMGSVTFYGIEAFFSVLGMSIIVVQQSTFIFWFFAMGLSMYFLIRTLYDGKNSCLVAFIASVFYILNHFTLHDWIIAEMSKWSVMTFLPLSIGLLWKFLNKKISLLSFIFYATIVSLVFNGGGGSGIPIFAGLLLSLFVFFFYLLFVEKKSFAKILKAYVTLLIVFTLANFYWIMPLVSVVLSDYSSFVANTGVDSVIPWVGVISRNASYGNLFRLQGFSSWYDSPSHPYSPTFLDEPFFIFLSLVFPIVSFSAVFLSKEKREKRLVIFFSILALFGIFLTAGNHPPLGFIYEFLIKNVYGFAIFRTPFYKFGYVIWFAYAFLFAFSMGKMLEYFRKKFFVALGTIFVIATIFIYNYPFFTGEFFNFNLPFSTMVKVPNYVLDTSEYLKTLPESSRILLVPPPAPFNGQSDVYNFGYFSRTPLPFQLTQKSIVTNVEPNSKLQEQLTEALYKSILDDNETKTKSYLRLLGVTHVLLRKDVLLTDKQYKVVDPNNFMKNLKKYTWIKKDKVLGEWEIYSLEQSANKISAYQNEIVSVFSKEKKYQLTQKIIDISDIGEKIIVVNNNENLENASITVDGNCISCEAEKAGVLPELKDPKVLPTSPFYLFVKAKEQKTLDSLKNLDYLYLRFVLIYSERKVKEIRDIADIEKDSEEEHMDEEQRRNMISAYKYLLSQIKNRYERSKELDKLEISRELISVLKREKEIFTATYGNPIYKDMESEYYSVLDLLDRLINDEVFLEKIEHLDKYYLFRLDIPIDGNYELSVESSGPEKIHSLDNRIINTSSSAFLTKGEHILEVSREQRKNLLKEENYVVKANEPRELTLENLSSYSRYSISSHVLENSMSSYSIEIISDDGERRFYRKITNSRPHELEGIFITKSVVSKPYILRITADGPTGEEELGVEKLKVVEDEYPGLVVKKKMEGKIITSPIITYANKNPTSYSVKVKNAIGPFILLFKETYSPFWKAELGDGIKLEKHFPANLDFNAWYVEKEGDYEISINYTLQGNYNIGRAISIIAIVGVFIIFIVSKLIKIKTKIL